MKKKKIVFVVIGAVVLIASIVAGIFLVRTNQDIRERAAPATTLAIKPATQTKDRLQDFTVQVVMDTGANRVTGLDLDISFDPAAFTINSITKGADISNFSQEIVNNIDNTTGKIKYSAFTLDSTKAVNGTNIAVLNIAGRVKDTAGAQTYRFTFNSTTAVSGSGEGQNVLTQSSPANIVVRAAGGGAGTPPPSGGATVRPTATPRQTQGPGAVSGTRTPTATPVRTPTQAPNNPTPTRTPTAVPTVSATSTPIPTLAAATPTSTATSVPIPQTGVFETTLAILGIGIVAIVISIFALAI